MRRSRAVVVLGAVIPLLILVAALVIQHRAGVDLRLLEELEIVKPGKTFSDAAADRPCPDVGPEGHRPPLEPGTLHLVPVGRAEAPTSLALIPDGSGDGFIGERAGRVRRVADGKVTDEILLDVVDDTFSKGDGGLVALVVDPDGDWLYVGRTRSDVDDEITAYPIEADGSIDAKAGRRIIRSGHPVSNFHHGGSMLFDDEGRMVFGFGDGGGIGDPRDTAQDLSTLLGKINRIIPTPDGDEPYEIPDDNPFVDRGGARPEIWAFGVRNPFRASYDTSTDTFWFGDVGQSCWEEITKLPPGSAGSNLGWDVLEGTHEFKAGPLAQPLLPPAFEINHRQSFCAVVVGPVQRGGALPTLEGKLLISDYCKGAIWALDAEHPEHVVDTGLHTQNPTTIATGPAGLPWVLNLEGEVLELRP